MTITCKNYPWQVLQLTPPLPPKQSKTGFIIWKVLQKPDFGRQWNVLLFCILAECGRGRRSIAEKADGSNGTIVPFVTSDDSRRDHETCWLLDVRSLTNPPDSVISSRGIKSKNFPGSRFLHKKTFYTVRLLTAGLPRCYPSQGGRRDRGTQCGQDESR